MAFGLKAARSVSSTFSDQLLLLIEVEIKVSGFPGSKSAFQKAAKNPADFLAAIKNPCHRSTAVLELFVATL